MGRRKRRLAKLFSVPVLAAAGFLVAATMAGVGIAQTATTSTSTSTSTSTTTTTTTTTTVPSFEGCTPGYWKSPQHADSWVGLTPGQTLESVFDVPDSLGIDSKTLDQALGPPGAGALNGGGPNGAYQLIRHAIAGILNANSPGVDYPYAAADIVAAVNIALALNNAGVNGLLKDILASANEARCPLN